MLCRLRACWAGWCACGGSCGGLVRCRSPSVLESGLCAVLFSLKVFFGLATNTTRMDGPIQFVGVVLAVKWSVRKTAWNVHGSPCTIPRPFYQRWRCFVARLSVRQDPMLGCDLVQRVFGRPPCQCGFFFVVVDYLPVLECCRFGFRFWGKKSS